MRRPALAALAAALLAGPLACGVRAPPRPPETQRVQAQPAPGQMSPSTSTTTSTSTRPGP